MSSIQSKFKNRWPVTTKDTGRSYLFIVNNRNTRARGEFCSKLTIKALEQQR